MPNPAPGTAVPVGSLVTPGGPPGVQGLTGQTGLTGPIGPASLGTFVLLSGAYTVVAGDSGKYFICSGGSWTLTLPAPQSGFVIALRNDMGITGTTGSITLSPTGGALINNASSLALLPGQECLLMCNGTNWRTFGRQRYVVIGTQDITSPQASGVVLLPVGYRYFELEFTGFQPAGSANDYVVGQLSQDGGATWAASAYYDGLIYNPSSTTVGAQDRTNVGNFYIIPTSYQGAQYAMGKLTLDPGGHGGYPEWHYESKAYNTASTNFDYMWKGCGLLTLWGVGGVANALKYSCGAGANIQNCLLTVVGVA